MHFPAKMYRLFRTTGLQSSIRSDGGLDISTFGLSVLLVRPMVRQSGFQGVGEGGSGLSGTGADRVYCTEYAWGKRSVLSASHPIENETFCVVRDRFDGRESLVKANP